MTSNNKKYKCCTYFNNVNGKWGYHCKDGHNEWKNKQGKKSSVSFSNHANNTIIYCYYLITTSEDSTEEEETVGGDSQDNDFISLSSF